MSSRIPPSHWAAIACGAPADEQLQAWQARADAMLSQVRGHPACMAFLLDQWADMVERGAAAGGCAAVGEWLGRLIVSHTEKPPPSRLVACHARQHPRPHAAGGGGCEPAWSEASLLAAPLPKACACWLHDQCYDLFETTFMGSYFRWGGGGSLVVVVVGVGLSGMHGTWHVAGAAGGWTHQQSGYPVAFYTLQRSRAHPSRHPAAAPTRPGACGRPPAAGEVATH
jgi:hypothetical protein